MAMQHSIDEDGDDISVLDPISLLMLWLISVDKWIPLRWISSSSKILSLSWSSREFTFTEDDADAGVDRVEDGEEITTILLLLVLLDDEKKELDIRRWWATKTKVTYVTSTMM